MQKITCFLIIVQYSANIRYVCLDTVSSKKKFFSLKTDSFCIAWYTVFFLYIVHNFSFWISCTSTSHICFFLRLASSRKTIHFYVAVKMRLKRRSLESITHPERERKKTLCSWINANLMKLRNSSSCYCSVLSSFALNTESNACWPFFSLFQNFNSPKKKPIMLDWFKRARKTNAPTSWDGCSELPFTESYHIAFYACFEHYGQDTFLDMKFNTFDDKKTDTTKMSN